MNRRTLAARWRVVAFVVICATCAVGASGYLVVDANRGTGEGDLLAGQAADAPRPIDPEVLTLARRPHLLFRSTQPDATFGSAVLADLDAPEGKRAASGLRCERVDFAGDRGICLTADRGMVTTYQAVVFDAELTVLFTQPLPGLPSRTRVSPDGRYGAMTTFVSGDSYAGPDFSTRTHVLDLRSGALVGDLEQFEVVRDGQRFDAVDFNFWGVTFAADGNRFYATLGTGGQRYLVEGDLAQRRMRVLRPGVECPMLSPDGTRLAFKQRVDRPGGRVEWRLAVLDLATLADHPLAESRNVDDQPAWLDNATVLYALPQADSGTAVTDTWAIADDGSGSPRRLATGAWSPVVVRP